MRPKPRTPESNDVFRELAQVPQHLKPKVTDWLQKVERLLKQQPQDSHKLYSLHAQPAGQSLRWSYLAPGFGAGGNPDAVTT